MSGLDIVLLVILAIALVRGFIKGFVMQLAALAALLLGIYVSIHFSSYLGNILGSKVSFDPVVIRWLSFGILFTLVVVAVHFTGKLVERLLKITMLSFLNRFTGALFSGIKTIFILAVLIAFFNSINQRVQIVAPEKTEKSVFFKPLSKIIPALFPRFFHKSQPGGNPQKTPQDSPQETPEETEEIVVDIEKSFIIKGKYYLCQNFSYDLG